VYLLLVPCKPQQTLAAIKLKFTSTSAAGDQEEYHDVVPGTQAGRPGEQLLTAPLILLTADLNWLAEHLAISHSA